MIGEVRFRNFKGLRHVDVDLGQLTVLVGPNASGKSSVLQGLEYMSRLLDTKPEEWLRAARSPFFCYSRNGHGELTIEVVASNWELRLQAFPKPPLPEPVLSVEAAESHRESWSFKFSPSFSKNGATWQGVDANQPHFMRNAVILRLDPAVLARPSVMLKEAEKSTIKPSGEGLASYLAYMRLNRPDDFDRIQQALAAVIPAVTRMRFDRVSVAVTEQVVNHQTGRVDAWQRSQLGESLVFDFVGAPDIPSHMVSDGTLLVLGLLTAFIGPHRANLVLLDDLDHGLHPKAQKDLMSLLRKLLQQNPQLQIVATTHSPYLLDCLLPEEVRLTALKSDGSVACARLDGHPEFEKWKDEMTPGEFWSVASDKWVPDVEPVES